MNKKIILLNSTILFVITTLWQQTFHEAGHFVTAILFHSKDIVLYHNYVQHDTSVITMNTRMVIAAAGPITSLLIGLFFHLICSRLKKRDLMFFGLLYMSAFGYINFGGYLMVSPFFKGGDTGFIFHQLGFPIWVTIIIAAGGGLFLYNMMKTLSRYFVEMMSEEIILDKAERKKYIELLVAYPLYIGVVITTILNLPVVAVLSLLYPLFSPFSLFWSFGYLLGTPYPTTNANKEMDKLATISPTLIIIMVFSIVCNRLFVIGWHW